MPGEVWYETLEDEIITTANLDRLLCQCEIIILNRYIAEGKTEKRSSKIKTKTT